MNGLKLLDKAHIVFGSPGIAAHATTGGDCDYVSLKNYKRCTIVIAVDNATTVTGCAVTLKQATSVAGGSEKALAFTTMDVNTDCGALVAGNSDTLTATAVTSNTFTTDTTDNKNQLYVIEVKDTDLDINNGFDCVRVDGLLQANSVSCVLYILHDPKYSGAATAAID